MIWFPSKKLVYWFSSYFRPHQRGPVRRMFSGGIFATLAIGLLAAVSLTSQSTTISIQQPGGTETVTVGEPFQIEVRIDAEEPINAVEIDLLYPEQYMEVEQIRDGESVLTIWTEEPSAADGVIHARGGTFRRGFIGDHRIFAFTARATQVGSFRIYPQQIRLLAGDGNGTEIDLGADAVPALELTALAGYGDSPTVGDATIMRGIDINGDGQVSMQDISIFMAAWGGRETIYDFNGDNRMSFTDFSVILARYFLDR